MTVSSSVMPKGVEHASVLAAGRDGLRRVSSSVMPKGVEHRLLRRRPLEMRVCRVQ